VLYEHDHVAFIRDHYQFYAKFPNGDMVEMFPEAFVVEDNPGVSRQTIRGVFEIYNDDIYKQRMIEAVRKVADGLDVFTRHEDEEPNTPGDLEDLYKFLSVEKEGGG